MRLRIRETDQQGKRAQMGIGQAPRAKTTPE
jgi:hypothetical protein